ncbi:MAG: TetR/AcrR family transcriptional regulator [Spongiibacteraceae bacterium]
MPVNSNAAEPLIKRLPTRNEKSELIKQRAIKAALEAFALYGFEGAKMKDIASNAGISLPLLVYHFSSKENLWETALKQAAKRFDEQIKDLNASEQYSSLDKLRQLVVSLVEICADYPEFHRIMAMESYQLSKRLVFLQKQCARHHHLSMIKIITDAQINNLNMSQIMAERLCFVMIGMARMSSNAAGYEYLSGAHSKALSEKLNIISDIYQLLRIEY